MHFLQDFTRTLSALPCGRAQHVRPMRSSIASMINFVLKFCSDLHVSFFVSVQ